MIGSSHGVGMVGGGNIVVSIRGVIGSSNRIASC